MTTKPELFRQLPSIDELLRVPALQEMTARFGHAATVEASRTFIDSLRNNIADGSLDDDELAAAIAQGALTIEQHLRESMGYSLRPVINATGVILHTNLGRAPLSDAALHVLSKSPMATRISNSTSLPANAANAMSMSVACLRNC